ncbi:hypothetical protein EXIGLDRAFT_761303 [Exidia glandulosa HHB12029]|uniref:Uncharacterized protein n=1 Tax=Exidia glandulosa HHB12029 TaxID=1314781 RepID=A0A165NP75_EXIGL|nr:hypothetical protein EXIGLDRAFT_761303 [Exidia glandulosa HHB12029]
MNLSDETATSDLSPLGPADLQRLHQPPEDSFDEEILRLIPDDIFAQTIDRDRRIMGKRIRKRVLESGSPNGDRGSDSDEVRTPSKTTPTKKKPARAPPNPPADPPERMPRGKKPVEASTRLTRAQKAAGVVQPVPPAPPRAPAAPLPAAPPARPPAKQAAPIRPPAPAKKAPAVKKPAKKAPVRPVVPRTPTRPKGPARAPKRTPARRVSFDVPEDDDDEDEVDQDDDDEDDQPEEPEDEEEVEQLPARRSVVNGRSARFARPETDEENVFMDVDDAEDAPAFAQPVRGAKRMLLHRSDAASAEDAPSPVRKKQATEDVWGRFVPGRTGDSRIATIPECARTIIVGGLRIYLPLHLFAPEVLRAEEKNRLAFRPDDAALTRVPQALVMENDMTVQNYMTWSKKLLQALDVLKVDGFVQNMFKAHFDFVQMAEDFELEWPTWRLYDIRRRSLVKGDEPVDISNFDAALYGQVQRLVNAQVNADRRRGNNAHYPRDSLSYSSHSNSYRPAAASGSSYVPAQSNHTRGEALKNLKYTRCIICGSNSHIYDKDSRHPARARWMVWDSRGDVWVTPDTHELVCWVFNSNGKCTKPSCRFRAAGHRCSLCGGDHSCHSCTK